MTNWIEIREKLPPSHMQVLFYIKNMCEGYTEDYCVQGCWWEMPGSKKENDKKNFRLMADGEIGEYEEVAFWTLLPVPPVTWK